MLQQRVLIEIARSQGGDGKNEEKTTNPKACEINLMAGASTWIAVLFEAGESVSGESRYSARL
jgi:hypothetical protein